jgi:hypothetical protein
MHTHTLTLFLFSRYMKVHRDINTHVCVRAHTHARRHTHTHTHTHVIRIRNQNDGTRTDSHYFCFFCYMKCNTQRNKYTGMCVYAHTHTLTLSGSVTKMTAFSLHEVRSILFGQGSHSVESGLYVCMYECMCVCVLYIIYSVEPGLYVCMYVCMCTLCVRT